jgi:hypothetical protein
MNSNLREGLELVTESYVPRICLTYEYNGVVVGVQVVLLVEVTGGGRTINNVY